MPRMILARKFIQSEDVNYEHIAAVSGRLRAVLEAFSEDRLPPEYGPDVLAAYARSLLAVQRPDGSFSSYPDPDRLDSDLRTDAHRFVTWAATAFLSLFAARLPDLAADVDGLESGLAKAMDSPAASDFTFPESGPAEPVQKVEAALILASGGIPARLEAAPGSGGSSGATLAGALEELKDDFRRRLETGETALPGGIDYAPLFLQALEALESGTPSAGN
jgi:hypothetical protein